jgi:hypothetical protein
MTIEEATQYAGWIQQAFPHLKMEPRLYIRALVHYDASIASRAILDAITYEWKMLPKVAEVVEVVRRAIPPPLPVQCETCNGHRLVVVATRLQEQTFWMKERGITPSDDPYEEWAACPDCNTAADASYHRFDGTKFVPPDPAKVREMLSR